MRSKNIFLALLGAVIGGVLGHFIFFWIARQGFYGLIIPGALLGFGAGICRTNSKYVSIVCGVLALALGFFTEWRFAPFVKDGSLGYFLSHITELKPITLIMIAAGGFLGFWIPEGRIRKRKKQNEQGQ